MIVEENAPEIFFQTESSKKVQRNSMTGRAFAGRLASVKRRGMGARVEACVEAWVFLKAMQRPAFTAPCQSFIQIFAINFSNLCV